MLSTRSHICATILFKWIKISYFNIGDFILLEINEHNNRDTQIIDILEQNSSPTKNIVPQSNMTEMFNLLQMSGVISSPELNALTNQGWYNQPIVSTPSVLSCQGFALKWVNGTTVTTCYRCGVEIPNPLKIPLEELVIVSRDYPEYRHRLTGQIQYSSNIQNVHFHLSVSCVLARCDNFVPANVVIPTDFWLISLGIFI